MAQLESNPPLAVIEQEPEIIRPTEAVASDGPMVVGPRRRSWPVRAMLAIGSAWEWVIGLAAVIVGLAVLAPLPILQFLSLGYLLEVSGRIARQGKLSAGFIGVRHAARVGTIVLGTYLVLLPLRLLSSLTADAWLVDPGGAGARFMSAALWACTGLAVLHIVGACGRGGRLRHFFWPRPIKLARQVFQRGAYARTRDQVWDFVTRMRLHYYFWLGLRGYLGALAWLIVPVTMLAAGHRFPLLGFLGGFLLILVVLYLPFVQTRFAAENRLRAMFEVSAVRELFRRAPFAFLLTLLLTLLFALPLYLLKIEIIPREAAWLPSLVFVIFILPARLLTGRAYAYAAKRPARRHWIFRITARLAMLPVAGIYVLFVYFTQFTSWNGLASLYEQHAFLLPVPFLGL